MRKSGGDRTAHSCAPGGFAALLLGRYDTLLPERGQIKMLARRHDEIYLPVSSPSLTASSATPPRRPSAPKREGPEEVNRPGPTALARFFEGLEFGATTTTNQGAGRFQRQAS